MPRSRPPIDAESAEIFFSEIRGGGSRRDACAASGFSESAVRDWISRGEGRHRTRKKTPEYEAFAARYRRELSEGKAALRKVVRSAGEKDWRAAAWLLERLHPEDYGAAKLDAIVKRHWRDVFARLGEALDPEVFQQVVEALSEEKGID